MNKRSFLKSLGSCCLLGPAIHKVPAWADAGPVIVEGTFAEPMSLLDQIHRQIIAEGRWDNLHPCFHEPIIIPYHTIS